MSQYDDPKRSCRQCGNPLPRSAPLGDVYHWSCKIDADVDAKALADIARDKRIAELEGELSVARLQIARIADEVIDPGMDDAAMRRAIDNIRYIINPAM